MRPYGITWATPKGPTHQTGYVFRTRIGAAVAALRGPKRQRTQVDAQRHVRKPGEPLYALIERFDEAKATEIRVR